MVEWLVPFLIVLGGMAIVFKSAEKSTESAATIAKILGISEMAIGFLLLSFATSLPELVISVSAALRGSPDLSVGNVFGANITNVTMVLGVAAMLGAVLIQRKDLKELVMILLSTSLISLLFVVYQPGRLTGGALIVIFLAYVYWLLRKQKLSSRPFDPRIPRRIMPHLGKFSLSIAIVILAAQIVVDNAIQLSHALGLAETVIGATIISLGTTLPELSVSINAVRKKYLKMAVGNAVGSSITNLSLIFGTTLLIDPFISFGPAVKLIVFSVIANIVLLYFIVIKGALTKRDGLLLALAYFAFLVLFGAGNL